MSVVSSILSTRSSGWKINDRLSSLMDSIFAIVSHHDFKLTGTLKMPKSSDPYVAYGVRLFVDFICTESVARLVLVLIWTALGMVLADVTPAIWDDVGLKRIGTRHGPGFYSSWTFDGRTSRRLSVYPDFNDTDLSSNTSQNDLDEGNLSSGASSASTERAGPSSTVLDTTGIPDMDVEEEVLADTAVAAPVKHEEGETTPRQQQVPYLPPTPSDSAARWRLNRDLEEPLPKQQSRSIPSPDDDWDTLNSQFISPPDAATTTNDHRQSLPPPYKAHEEFDDIYGDFPQEHKAPAPTTHGADDEGAQTGNLIDDSISSGSNPWGGFGQTPSGQSRRRGARKREKKAAEEEERKASEEKRREEELRLQKETEEAELKKNRRKRRNREYSKSRRRRSKKSQKGRRKKWRMNRKDGKRKGSRRQEAEGERRGREEEAEEAAAAQAAEEERQEQQAKRKEEEAAAERIKAEEAAATLAKAEEEERQREEESQKDSRGPNAEREMNSQGQGAPEAVQTAQGAEAASPHEESTQNATPPENLEDARTLTAPVPEEPPQPEQPQVQAVDEESVVSMASEMPGNVRDRVTNLLLLKAQMVEMKQRIEELKEQADASGGDEALQDIQRVEKVLRKMQKKESRRYDETKGITHEFLDDQFDTGDSIALEGAGLRGAETKIEEKLEELLSPETDSIKLTINVAKGQPGKKQKQNVTGVLDRYKLLGYTREKAKVGRVMTVDVPSESFAEWLIAFRSYMTQAANDSDSY
ncbi:hypothetical protein BDZ97DRAFT_1787836 [Flammula alnicola]|nr:hypothetical protein BDZ97DRAFT_1787836 [Flammula alnicola]